MSVELFLAPGRFYRGNLHTHSTRSDGLLEPAEVCRRYRERGYDFISLTDHFSPAFDFPITDTTPYRTDGFTTIIGAECHAPVTSGGEQWHILAVGLPLDFPRNATGETGPEIARRCLEAGAFVAVPHPEWYSLTIEDALSIPGAHAIEVYNHTSHVRQARGGGAYFLDAVLNAGRRVNALACDDAHWIVEGDEERDAFGGWVMVKAQSNEPAALLDALKAGHYYSTQGPMLEDIVLGDRFVSIRCSPVAQIMLVGRGSRNDVVSGHDITSARLPCHRYAGDWCRVMIMSSTGEIAWSNPIYLPAKSAPSQPAPGAEVVVDSLSGR